MHIVRYILLLGLAFVLQTTWLDFISVSALKPDLILLIITIVALREGPISATLLGFSIGLLQDAYAPADFGLNALLKCTAGFAVGLSAAFPHSHMACFVPLPTIPMHHSSVTPFRVLQQICPSAAGDAAGSAAALLAASEPNGAGAL